MLATLMALLAALTMQVQPPGQKTVDLKLFSAGQDIRGESTEFVVRVTNTTKETLVFVYSPNMTDIRVSNDHVGHKSAKRAPGRVAGIMLVAEMTGDLPGGVIASGSVEGERLTLAPGEMRLLHFDVPRNRLPSNHLRIWAEFAKAGSTEAEAVSNAVVMRRALE